MKEIKRSEISNMAKRNGLDSDQYIDQLVREYPELIIIDDCNDFKNRLRDECIG